MNHHGQQVALCIDRDAPLAALDRARVEPDSEKMISRRCEREKLF
jgi:hypothetical protein